MKRDKMNQVKLYHIQHSYNTNYDIDDRTEQQLKMRTNLSNDGVTRPPFSRATFYFVRY